MPKQQTKRWQDTKIPTKLSIISLLADKKAAIHLQKFYLTDRVLKEQAQTVHISDSIDTYGNRQTYYQTTKQTDGRTEKDDKNTEITK